MILIEKKLRVYHFPNIPCKEINFEVRNEREAYLLYNTIANQHLFLFENNFIPDFSNAIGVQMQLDDGDWVDYFNESECMEWDELTEAYIDLLT